MQFITYPAEVETPVPDGRQL